MARFRIFEAARLLGVSDDTVRRWIGQGRLTTVEGETPFLVEGRELAALALELGEASPHELPGALVPNSARNRLPGIVTAVKRDPVMTQVDLQAGPFRVVSVISTEAADELDLHVGVATVATVRATDVVLERPSR